MQADRDALLAGILADPDADLPRLVFADWLEETGHPANCARAEYIRLAIERFGTHKWSKSRTRMLNQLDQLKSMFEDEWDPFTQIARSADPGGEFSVSRSRGFVDTISIDAVLLHLISAELTQLHPVSNLNVFINRPTQQSEPQLPHFPALQGLSIVSHQSRGLWPGAQSPCNILLFTVTPCRLRHLKIQELNFGDGDLVSLVHLLRGNPALGQLESLNLSGNELTDQAAITLAAADWPPGFRSLNVTRTRITNAGREVLFRRFGFEELRPRLALS